MEKNKKIAISSSHEYELAGIMAHLDKHYKAKGFFEFTKNEVSIFPTVLGIGPVMTTYGIANSKQLKDVDMFIYMGLGAGMPGKVNVGNVYQIVSEKFADLGTSSNDNFEDIFDLELFKTDKFPFNGKQLVNESYDPKEPLEMAFGASVNTISDNPKFIETIQKKYDPDILSFDGAALHYCCKMYNIKFIQLRAVSTILGSSEGSSTTLALANLTNKVIALMES